MNHVPSDLSPLTVTTTVIALEADGDFHLAGELMTRLSSRGLVEIGGVRFHMELYEVNENGDAVNSSLREQVDAVTTLCGARPDEMTIQGRNYVAAFFPVER